jgi:hypothetical protein
MRKSEYDLYIGRPSKWGNPYFLTKETPEARQRVILQYKANIMKRPELLRDLKELEGKTLGCFCAPKACHGDVLKELVENGIPIEGSSNTKNVF